MIATELWSMLGGVPSMLDALTITGDERVLPSVFDVTGFAAATVGVATLAVAELQAARNDDDVRPATVDTLEACAAFLCEALFSPIGWDRVGIWDPIAGDYETADGWIRLHTNYPSHRAAALRALGLDDANRDAVTAFVASETGDDLEARVVTEGGAAAVMRTREQWSAHQHGAAIASQAPIALAHLPTGSGAPLGATDGPALGGVKVLDLTRVLAGPFGTRFLAAWGADVLRIDPPGFEEVPAIVPEATAGKRTAFLDLATDVGRSTFESLVAEADVLVHGYRPGALAKLGLDDDRLRAVNPALVISQHDAYGWTGPWAERRGFDSLVQMSCGIAAARGADRPRPLPCQALDHGTGFLLAAAVCRALAHRERTGSPSDIRGALVGAANVLFAHPDPDAIDVDPPPLDEIVLEDRVTDLGPARAVPIPGAIDGVRPQLVRPAGPLGRHEASFS